MTGPSAFEDNFEAAEIVEAIAWMFCAARHLENMSDADFQAWYMRNLGYPARPGMRQRLIDSLHADALDPDQARRVLSGEEADHALRRTWQN